MKALIIAAGCGSRLRQRFSPKPLITILGLSLIERTILASKKAGIYDFGIAVGYRADEIMQKIDNGEKYGVRIEYIQVPQWDYGNGYSVFQAKKVFGNEKFILLMCDHLFDESILKNLMQVNTQDGNCILCVDRDIENGHLNIEDSTKVQEEDGNILKIGKNIKNYNVIDTGIFLCSPSIFGALEKSISCGECSLSAGNQVLADERKLKALDVTGHFWVDVDDEPSFKEAKSVLIKSLVKGPDGFISHYINRRISIKFSSFLANYNVTPNAITLFGFFLAVLSALFFSFGSYTYSLIAGFLVQLSSIVDGCDGEIARLKFSQSRYGKWLDRILDRYADMFIIFGMTYNCWIASPHVAVLFIGFAAVVGTFMISYINFFIEELQSENLLSEKVVRPSRDNRLFIIFLGALANQLLVILVIMAVVTNLYTLSRLLVYKKIEPDNIH